MYTFLVIVSSTAAPQAASLLEGMGAIRSEPNNRYIVEGNGGMKDGWIAVYRNDEVINDFDEDELKHVETRIKNPAYFVVEGRDTKTNFANDFIMRLSGPVLIDNDQGRIFELEDLKNMILNDIAWRQ